MPTRAEHVADIVARLEPILVPEHLNVFEGTRVMKFSSGKLPVGVVYGTGENATVEGRGWRVSYTLKIDLMVKADDGFDQITGPIMEAIKANLFGDPVWLGRWQGLPNFTVGQFRDADVGDAVAFETIVLSCTDVETTSYPPPQAADMVIEGVDVAGDLRDDAAGSAPDGHSEFSVSVSTDPV